MTPTTFFQGAGDILQFAIPTAIGIQDVAPDVCSGAYRKGTIKAMKICTLILIQRYGCMLIKNIVKKRRPDGSDLQSFPSGHFMIGAQCLARFSLPRWPFVYNGDSNIARDDFSRPWQVPS